MALGQVDAGFVYLSDYVIDPTHLTLIKVPAWAQPKITYAMAIVTKSPNQAAAQAWMTKVLSPAGQAIFVKNGFLPLTAPVPTIAKVAPAQAKAGATVTLTGTNFTRHDVGHDPGRPGEVQGRLGDEADAHRPGEGEVGHDHGHQPVREPRRRSGSRSAERDVARLASCIGSAAGRNAAGSTTASAKRRRRSASASTRSAAGIARAGSRPSATRATAGSCPRARSTACAASRARRTLSARNRFNGVVTDVKVDGLIAQVEMVVSDPVRLVALVTRDAVEELELRPGMSATAIVKSTSVMVQH